MYHVVEFEGVRKTVKASPSATCTEVAALAFGFDPWGDTRTSKMRVVGSTKSKDVAAGMMCKVWPAVDNSLLACQAVVDKFLTGRPCVCEICDPHCGRRRCAGFHRIHGSEVTA